MNKNDVQKFLNDICDLIMDNLSTIEKTRYQISMKEDGTPVTNSDVFVEKLIYQYVSNELQDVVFIGEESYNFSEVNTTSYVVLLDPVDGTENFCSGLKEWGISFSLWKDNKHLGSFLLMPELNIRLLSGDELQYIETSRITGVSSSMSDSILNHMKEPGQYRMIGCAVYNLYLVITGSFKQFVNPKGAYVWDILPGMMLALEHGCQVNVDGKEFRGEFLAPNQTYCIEVKR